MVTMKTMMSTTTVWGWKPHWAQSRKSKAWLGSRNAMNVERQDTGLLNVPTRKRKDEQKRLVLQQMQALREPNPSAVTVANQVTRKRTAGRNTRTKPHLGAPRQLEEGSWMRSCLCATLHKMRCPTSRKAERKHTIVSLSYRTDDGIISTIGWVWSKTLWVRRAEEQITSNYENINDLGISG